MTDEIKGVPESVINESPNPARRRPLHPTYARIQRNRARQERDDARNESSTDYLTGLKSRKYFQQELKRGFDIASRDPAGPGIGFQMIDIDNFKSFNDRFGHSKGDEVLTSVGQAIKKSIRSVDIAGREGGEEFGVLMPYGEMGAPLNTDEFPAERVRNEVEKMLVEGVEEPITVSIGTTDYYPDDSFEDFYKRAERAMIAAKRLGRNRVVKAVKREEGVVYLDMQTNLQYSMELDEKEEIIAIQEQPLAV